MKKTIRNLGLWIAITMSIPLFLALAYILLMQGVTWYAYATWKGRTSPLERETVADLCTSLRLTRTTLCDSGEELYAPDFFPSIEEFFTMGSGRDMTKSEVDSMFSEYELSCENPEHPEGYPEHYRCWYDLRGDRAFKFVIAYTADNQVYYASAKLVVGD